MSNLIAIVIPKKNEMGRLVGEMLVTCIIQPSNSPFSSNVLVRKKDRSWCFYVDYHQLNKVTIHDKYPIPMIQEMLEELGGAQYFRKLDLRLGYHQIQVTVKDVHKTEFRTHSSNAFQTYQCPLHLPSDHE